MTGPAERIARGAVRRVRAAFGLPRLPAFDHLIRRAYGALPRPVGGPSVTLVVPRRPHGMQSSTWIRLLGPLTYDGNGRAVRLKLADATGAATVPIGELVVVQRDVMPDAAAAERLAARVRRSGARLVVDCDDDFRLLDPARAAALDLLMRRADQVWFSTAVLQETYRHAADDRGVVVPNALDPRLWGPPPPERPRAGPGVRILYMGTLTHDADFAAILPALDAFAATRPGTELCLIGAVTRDPGRSYSRIVPVPPHAVEYPLFVRWLQQQGPFDLGIAPLADRPFNAAKSDIKLLDYCALCLPALVADMPPYRDPVRPDDIAQRVANDTGSWLEALLAFDPADTAAGRQRRLDYAWNQRSIASVADRVAALIASLLSRQA
ncbi:MAG: hypothetical protein KIS68_12285 [Bauldia sp.]|nr:hypothetical protein [Bauldia sp.]